MTWLGFIEARKPFQGNMGSIRPKKSVKPVGQLHLSRAQA
jgi:hypothetical protein